MNPQNLFQNSLNLCTLDTNTKKLTSDNLFQIGLQPPPLGEGASYSSHGLTAITDGTVIAVFTLDQMYTPPA